MNNIINSLESQVEYETERETEVVRSMEEIGMVLESLEDDPELLQAAEKIKNARQEELIEIEAHLEEAYKKGEEIYKHLQEYSQTCLFEKNNLDVLTSMGEDVGEAYEVLEERWEKISGYAERLNCMMGKLETKENSYITKNMADMIGGHIIADAAYLDRLSKDELLAARRLIRTRDSEIGDGTKKVKK